MMSFLKNAILYDVSYYFSFEGFSSAHQPSEVECSQLAFPGTSHAQLRRGPEGSWATLFTITTYRVLISLTVCGLYVKAFSWMYIPNCFHVKCCMLQLVSIKLLCRIVYNVINSCLPPFKAF